MIDDQTIVVPPGMPKRVLVQKHESSRQRVLFAGQVDQSVNSSPIPATFFSN